MKLSLTTLVAIVSAMGAVDALSIPNSVAGLQKSFQLNHHDRFADSYEKFVSKLGSGFDKIGAGGEAVMQAIAKHINDPLENVSDETKKVWSEMLREFPETIMNMNFKTLPKKFKSKAFDHYVTSTKVPDHKLRVKSTPESLGIDKVKQYSGYLDVEEEDKHFFFWAFESRNDPANDPVVLWLNGGPGCSSLTGLFFELGPASITSDLKPKYNPHSWNNNATVIFLDQPVNVGYSYSSGSVTNTVNAGKDVYAFLELFFKQYPQFSHLPFHISGESYAGHYIPVFASEILSHEDRSFNFTSVLIGNGLTDPLNQYEHYQPMACGGGGYPAVLDEETCQSMTDSIPRCLSLINTCYNTQSVWSCVPASIYCNNAELGPYQRSGKNPYDVRTNCEGNNLCYNDLSYIDEYLNQDYVKEALGAEVEKYEGCNFDINRNFLLGGDWMKPYFKNVIDILEQKIPTLIYAGDKDFICNWLGNRAWTDKLEWSGSKGFSKAEIKDWKVGKHHAGEVKNFEHFTFLRVFDGGHMVPYDQPKNSLDMLNRWIGGDYTFQ